MKCRKNIALELVFLDGVTLVTYLEMLRVVKFVLDSKCFCLQLCPKCNNTHWNLEVFCDSDLLGLL
jgi:hypothetical protein